MSWMKVFTLTEGLQTGSREEDNKKSINIRFSISVWVYSV